MIVFGWGSGAKQIGTGFITTCDNCNNTNPFIVVESCKKISVYWIPIAKWSKKYFYVCPICSHGISVPTKDLAQRIIADAFGNPLGKIDAKLLSDLKSAINLNE